MKYDTLINEVKSAKVSKSKSSLDYKRLKRFDTMTFGNTEKLITPLDYNFQEKFHLPKGLNYTFLKELDTPFLLPFLKYFNRSKLIRSQERPIV